MHALEEADDDDFSVNDVENAILNGEIAKKYTHDPRGTRYEIHGPAEDGRMMFVVCRFCEKTGVLILTVFGDFGEFE
jgi:hypothetical protein